MDAQPRDLLNADDLLAEPLKPARWTKRLANLLLDTVFFYIIIVTIGLIAVLISPEFVDAINRTDPLLDRLVGTLLYAVYCFGFEAWLGKTPGKMITRTKVVGQNGERPDLYALIRRSLARIIPFDALTFMRQTPIGLHDRLGQTMVVDDRPLHSFDRSLANADE